MAQIGIPEWTLTHWEVEDRAVSHADLTCLMSSGSDMGVKQLIKSSIGLELGDVEWRPSDSHAKLWKLMVKGEDGEACQKALRLADALLSLIYRRAILEKWNAGSYTVALVHKKVPGRLLADGGRLAKELEDNFNCGIIFADRNFMQDCQWRPVLLVLRHDLDSGEPLHANPQEVFWRIQNKLENYGQIVLCSRSAAEDTAAAAGGAGGVGEPLRCGEYEILFTGLGEGEFAQYDSRNQDDLLRKLDEGFGGEGHKVWNFSGETSYISRELALYGFTHSYKFKYGSNRLLYAVNLEKKKILILKCKDWYGKGNGTRAKDGFLKEMPSRELKADLSKRFGHLRSDKTRK